MEERNGILDKARKLVPGPRGAPLADPNLVMVAFPAMCRESTARLFWQVSRLHQVSLQIWLKFMVLDKKGMKVPLLTWRSS